MKMSESSTSRLYDTWASIYDRSFGPLVHRRQRIAVEQLRLQPGDRVLDLGVGTGGSLDCYPRGVEVVGMDLSGGMLARAADKLGDPNLPRVRLVQGDAMHPPFAEGTFDHVVVTHVISCVSDPRRLMTWAARMVKPTGRIVVLNHFRSPVPLVSFFEKVFNPLFVRIGWRSDLRLEESFDRGRLTLHYAFKMSLLDLWQVAVFTPKTNDRLDPVLPADERVHEVTPPQLAMDVQ